MYVNGEIPENTEKYWKIPENTGGKWYNSSVEIRRRIKPRKRRRFLLPYLNTSVHRTETDLLFRGKAGSLTLACLFAWREKG